MTVPGIRLLIPVFYKSHTTICSYLDIADG